MKYVSIITIILVLMMISSIGAAERSSIAALKAVNNADRVEVSIELKNIQPMTALDLPLKFTEGVTLEEAIFEGTRSEDFDLAVAKIDNDKNTVVIGLIPMVFGEKEDLPPGAGVVARLIFKLDDPEMDEFGVELTTITKAPCHEALYVYTENVDGKPELRSETPDFLPITVALSEIGSQNNDEPSNLPTVFALNQNYPNPFNPTTTISFDLPVASHVKLEVLNVLGQRVNTVADRYFEAGSNLQVQWDGNDYSGSSAASGVYFYRIQAGANTAVKKMMMLK